MRNQNAKKNKTGKVATNFMLAPSHVSGAKKVMMRAPNNETKKDIRQPNKNKATIHVTATMSIHMPNWGDWYPIWISCTTAEKAAKPATRDNSRMVMDFFFIFFLSSRLYGR